MYANIPYYEGHTYTEGKGYDISGPTPIIGWHTDEDGFDWPILPRTTPEYQARLDAINERHQRSYRGPSYTAEELDARCTEMAEKNEAYRVLHGL